jgi:uncharacterized protein YdaU (DUF1376 family)
MARPWYSFYPADYGRDTGHLSLVEHGAYRVLMDHYYATAAPLPADIARLIRLCRAQGPAEQEAVRFVLAEFFLAGEDGFRHPRIDAEIEKAAALAVKGAFGGRVSAARRAKKAPSRTPTESQASQSPSQSPEIDKSEAAKDNGFEAFWAAYPRREARGLARQAFAKAARGVAAQTLIAAARAYAARREGQDGQFTKLASTWLAQECWLDDVAAPAASDSEMRQAWSGCAAPLVAEIGAAVFQAYFGEAAFAQGPPARITVGAPYLRDLIARKFSPAIRRAFGEFELEVAA